MIKVREFGWLYLPRSIGAWLLAMLMAAFCVHIFLAVDARSHSVSDTLYGLFPFWSVTFLLWNWVGSRATKS
ncbi:hypothetical protein [Dyella agri]|uniref:Uncharacterized protein n=1 Tax=Dyella agri TaxID=1926869 RepID=A0ABW8KJW3_9GAMM